MLASNGHALLQALVEQIAVRQSGKFVISRQVVDPVGGNGTLPCFFRELDIGFAQFLGPVCNAHPQYLVVLNEGSTADGQIRSHLVDRQAESADFVITGPYSRWKQVAKKELDATKGIMLGQLKLKGDFPTLVRYTKASQEMTECTTRVPVNWPDE